jgi:hypothetical protein
MSAAALHRHATRNQLPGADCAAPELNCKQQMWGLLCAAGAQQQAGQQKAGEDRKREMRVCLL